MRYGTINCRACALEAKLPTVAQYRAQYDADVAAYRQTVLTAFEQSEDSLASLHILDQQLQPQLQAVTAAQRYYDLANARFHIGVDTYLNVFIAQTSLLSNQQTALTLHIQQMTSSVQLIEALGGGWNMNLLPSEKEVAARTAKP